MFEEEQIQVLDPLEFYYSKKLYLSYSAAKLLLWSPILYRKKYIDLATTDDSISANLLEGKVIHCLMLNKHLFDELFLVSPANLPTGNTKLIIDKIYRARPAIRAIVEGDDELTRVDWDSLDTFKSNILGHLESMNLHQSLTDDKKADKDGVKKTGNEKRLEKIISDETRSYWEFLLKKGSRDVIDQTTYDKCEYRAGLLNNHTEIRKLMGIDIDAIDIIQVVNETMFKADLNKFPFGLKGIIDNLNINHTKKIIYLNDVKTTGKSLVDFKESVEFFMYWLQAVIYGILVFYNYKELVDKGYKLEFRFIVIDTNDQVYPFLVSEDTLSKWTVRAEEIFKTVLYHYKEKSFNLPMLYEKGLVIL